MPNKENVIHDTVPAALKEALTGSMGSMAKNALFTDLVHMAVAILHLVGTSE